MEAEMTRQSLGRRLRYALEDAEWCLDWDTEVTPGGSLRYCVTDWHGQTETFTPGELADVLDIPVLS